MDSRASVLASSDARQRLAQQSKTATTLLSGIALSLLLLPCDRIDCNSSQLRLLSREPLLEKFKL